MVTAAMFRYLILLTLPGYGISVCYHEGVKYEHRDRFMVKCNKCFCAPNGELACTKWKCEKPVCHFNERIYQPGDDFKIGCNYCFCADGVAACTQKICTNCVHNGIPYKTGVRFKDDCNNCTCLRNGQTKCTRKTCEPCKDKDGKEYKSGTNFKMDCNKCSCRSGKISCTKTHCIKGVKGESAGQLETSLLMLALGTLLAATSVW